MPLLEVPSGIVADRWSRNGILVLASIALATSSLLGGLSTNVLTYLIAAMILGIYFAMNSDTRFDVLLRSEQTHDALAVTENTVPAGWPGPPLHHHDFDETFYVLDGELVFQLGYDVCRAEAGTLVFARRGAHHTLANHSAHAARYLLMITPPGFERYFDRLSAELTGTTPPPESQKPFPETITVGPQIDPERAR